MEGKRNQKVSFNVAGPHALQMAELQRQCTMAYQSGDFINWFSKLSSVNEHIYYAIPKNERAVFDKIFKKCELLKKWYIREKNINYFGEGEKTSKIKRGSNYFKEYVRIYSRMISDQLFEQGWFPTRDQIKKVSFDN